MLDMRNERVQLLVHVETKKKKTLIPEKPGKMVRENGDRNKKC